MGFEILLPDSIDTVSTFDRKLSERVMFTLVELPPIIMSLNLDNGDRPPKRLRH